ncbi:MAG: flagellar basal-body MS-ring/collar protein FliF [Planctomycetota bacterium]|jgi:flagellar M-ring protein FliF
MNFFQKLNAVWQKVGFVQRALLIAIVLAFIVISALLTNWARRPDMRMLYQQLSPDEASKITEKISEKGIVYELRNGGTSIYVPEEKVYQLRLDMAREGLASGEQGGYKIFDNEKIGVSPFVQSVNLKRALQEELAKSIQMIDGVIHARVHMVTPEQTLFTSEADNTTASVVLRLKPGYRLSALNIAAITNLVSGSVEGLTSESVTVIDSQGRLLSSQSDLTMANGAGTVQEYRERVEQNLSDKVEEMLTTVLGPGRATVRVSAVIDMNSISTVTEKLEPKGVATKEEITTGNETEPSTISTAGQPAAPGGIKKDETIVTEYEIGKTVKQEVVLPGQVKSLSVAAFVDLTATDANEAASTGSSALIMELTEVEEIIRNALGLKKTDALKVVNVRFHRPDVASMVDEEPSSWPRIMGIVRHASLGIMAICALFVLRIFKGAKKKAGSGPIATTAQLAGAEGPAALLPAEAGKSEPLVLRKQIASALQSNPVQVKQLFSNWIEEKGG